MANRFATSTALSRPLTWNALAQCLVFARNRAVESDLAASARPRDRFQAGLMMRGTGWFTGQITSVWFRELAVETAPTNRRLDVVAGTRAAGHRCCVGAVDRE